MNGKPIVPFQIYAHDLEAVFAGKPISSTPLAMLRSA